MDSSTTRAGSARDRRSTGQGWVGVLSSSGMRSTIGNPTEAQAAKHKALRQPALPGRRLRLRRVSDALRVTDDERTPAHPDPTPTIRPTPTRQREDLSEEGPARRAKLTLKQAADANGTTGHRHA